MIDETKIMQYADGTLPQEEHEEVKKAIEAVKIMDSMLDDTNVEEKIQNILDENN